jgi:hypothetical protein
MRLLVFTALFCMFGGLCLWFSHDSSSVDLADLAAESDRMDEALDVVVQRNQVKTETARDVADGRLTLKEAVARFRTVHEGEFTDEDEPPTDEWLALNVAVWVKGILRARAGTSCGDPSRLEPELRRLLRDPRVVRTSLNRLPRHLNQP